MRQFQHRQDPQNPNRTPTHHRIFERHGDENAIGIGIRLQKQIGRGGSGSGFTPVKGLHALAIKMHQKRATADATALWFDQRQHHLNGNRRIHRTAARLQHLQTRLRGEGVGCGYGMGLGCPSDFFDNRAGSFGLLRPLVRRSTPCKQDRHHRRKFTKPSEDWHTFPSFVLETRQDWNPAATIPPPRRLTSVRLSVCGIPNAC